jgi:UDP-glucose 4-epimerase
MTDEALLDFYKNRKILITGGLGFIGSNLAISLVELGAKVYLVDALLPDYGGNRFNIDSISHLVKWEIGDIRNKPLVDGWVKEKDLIFNLAGTLSHVDSMSDPMTDLEINCRAQLSLLESVREHNPKTKIIFAGTRNQYGKAQKLPVTEDHPQIPTDINGINNIAAEKYHLMYTKVYGIKTISLRMTNTYGPRHQMKHSRQGVLNWFLREILDNKKVVIYGSGKQIRDVNYIDDVVNALLLTGTASKGWGEAYNLGGTSVSLLDFVKLAIQIHRGGSFELVSYPKDREAIEIGDYVASYEKMRKTLGWRPVTSLETGIKRTIGFYRKYKKYYW